MKPLAYCTHCGVGTREPFSRRKPCSCCGGNAWRWDGKRFGQFLPLEIAGERIPSFLVASREEEIARQAARERAESEHAEEMYRDSLEAE